MASQWKIALSRDAKKQYKKLAHCGHKKPSLLDVIDAFVLDLRQQGPILVGWPHYGVIHESKTELYYHCHLKRGHPTYVACWRVTNVEENKIEVFYVGTHEGAPY